MGDVEYWEDARLPCPARWKDADGRVVPGPDDRTEYEREIITRQARSGGTVIGSRVTPRRVLLEVQRILDREARRMLDEELRNSPSTRNSTQPPQTPDTRPS